MLYKRQTAGGVDDPDKRMLCKDLAELCTSVSGVEVKNVRRWIRKVIVVRRSLRWCFAFVTAFRRSLTDFKKHCDSLISLSRTVGSVSEVPGLLSSSPPLVVRFS